MNNSPKVSIKNAIIMALVEKQDALYKAIHILSNHIQVDQKDRKYLEYCVRWIKAGRDLTDLVSEGYKAYRTNCTTLCVKYVDILVEKASNKIAEKQEEKERAQKRNKFDEKVIESFADTVVNGDIPDLKVSGPATSRSNVVIPIERAHHDGRVIRRRVAGLG